MRPYLPLMPLLALVACKPPPTDADIAAQAISLPSGPSEPIESPDTKGAIWADSSTADRIIYGIAGQHPLAALACIDAEPTPVIRLTRYAKADEGAKAFVALIGNGHIARIPIDAAEVDGIWLWQAEVPAGDPDLEVLTGGREVAVTIPGAGRLVLNSSTRPGALIDSCRAKAPAENELSEDALPAR